VNFPFLIENCQKESLASLPSAGEPEDSVKRVKPRRRNEESSVREKEGDLLWNVDRWKLLSPKAPGDSYRFPKGGEVRYGVTEGRSQLDLFSFDCIALLTKNSIPSGGEVTVLKSLIFVDWSAGMEWHFVDGTLSSLAISRSLRSKKAGFICKLPKAPHPLALEPGLNWKDYLVSWVKWSIEAVNPLLRGFSPNWRKESYFVAREIHGIIRRM